MLKKVYSMVPKNKYDRQTSDMGKENSMLKQTEIFLRKIHNFKNRWEEKNHQTPHFNMPKHNFRTSKKWSSLCS